MVATGRPCGSTVQARMVLMLMIEPKSLHTVCYLLLSYVSIVECYMCDYFLLAWKNSLVGQHGNSACKDALYESLCTMVCTQPCMSKVNKFASVLCHAVLSFSLSIPQVERELLMPLILKFRGFWIVTLSIEFTSPRPVLSHYVLGNMKNSEIIYSLFAIMSWKHLLLMCILWRIKVGL